MLKMGNKIPSAKSVNKTNKMINGEIDDILRFEYIIFVTYILSLKLDLE
jgi:hypothetical protein